MSDLEERFREAVDEVNKARTSNGQGMASPRPVLRPDMASTMAAATAPGQKLRLDEAPVMPPWPPETPSVTKLVTPPRPPVMRPVTEHNYDFEVAGEQIAAAMVQAAQEQLTRAQNTVEEVKAFADDVRARIATKAKELDDLNARLRSFCTSILEAHDRFHGTGEGDDK
jgi:hypothetical protein